MKSFIAFLSILALIAVIAGCSKDSKSSTEPVVTKDAWIGTWLSAGTNVAPILVAVFNYDSVRVTINEDKTVTTDSHVKNGAWTSTTGTWAVTKSASGDVHSVEFVYPAFSQEGILQVTTGTPDQLKLEVVQTVPDIGATPRTPDTGFGSDATLGAANIQTYVREK